MVKSINNIPVFYNIKKLLMLFVISVLLTTPITTLGQQKRIALVIGNSSYKSAPLKNPVNDVLLMKTTFEKLGFDVMLDTNIQKRDKFLSTIIEFGEKREKYDVAFVYYAGHAVQIEGVNYLLATNENYNSIGQVKGFGIDVKYILDYLDANSGQINVLILDACRNNPFEQNWISKTRSLEVGNGLAEMSTTGALIAFATSAGSTAGDGDNKNSLYCSSLSKNFLSENTSLDQVFRNVRAEVRKLSGDKQKPTIDNQLEGDAFYLKKSTYLDQIKSIDSLIEANNYILATEKVNIILAIDNTNKQALLRKGRIKYNTENSKYDGSDLFKAQKLYPNDPEVYIYLARYYSTLKKNYEALSKIEFALKLDSSNAETYFWKARIYEDFFKYDSALINYCKAINYNKSNARWYQERGFFYERQNRIKEALDDLNKAIELDKNNAERYDKRAQFFVRQKDYKNALIDYSKTVELNPNDINYLYSRGQFYHTILNQHKNAITDFELILTHYHDYIPAIIELGLIFEDQGDLDEAIRYYEKGINLQKKDAQGAAYCYNNRATIYQKQNKLAEALSDINKSVELAPANSDRYYTRGNFFRGQNDFNNALIDYSRAIELNPNNIEYLYGRGLLYYEKLKDSKKAISDFEQMLKIQNDNLDAINAIGVIYQDQEDYESAIKQYEKGIALEKTNPLASAYCYGNRAAIFEKQNRIKEALSDYTKAIELDKTNATRYYKRGQFYNGQKDYNNALIDYSKAIELDPYNIDYLYSRGYAYIDNLNDTKKAISDFEQILKIKPDFIDAINSIGTIHEKQGNLDSAIKQYEKGIALEKSNPEGAAFCYVNRARIHEQESKLQQALADYSNAIEIDKDNAEIYYMRGFVYLKQNDFNNALIDYSRAIELNPNNIEYLHTRGLLYYEKLNDSKKAIADYEQILKIKPDNVNAINGIGAIYQSQGNIDLAVKQYEKGISLEITSPLAAAYCYQNRALIYEEQKKFKEALSDLTKAINLDKNNAERYHTRGKFFKRQSDFNNALIDYSKAIELDSVNVDYFYNRGVITYQNKSEDYRKAISDHEKALKIKPDYIRSLNYIGYIYYQLGDYNNALKEFEKSIALENKFPSAASYSYYLRALIYTNQNKIKDALSDYTKSIELIKNNSVGYLQRGYFFQDILKDKYRALEDFSFAHKLDSTATNILFARGKLYSDKFNDHAGAIKDFKKIIRIDSTDATAMNWIGVFYDRMNDEENAKKYYYKTISMENLTFKDTLSANRHGIAWSYNNLAESFQNEKDYSRALDFYTKAIKRDSLNAIRYYYRSWLLSEYINDNNNAIKDIDKAIKLDKNDPRWFLMQAKVFERMNNNSKALNAYNESIKLSNNSAEFVSERGKFYFKIGEESKALLDIDNAVKKDSLFKKSYYYKAEILIGQNKQLEAINMLKKVSEKFENDTISNKLIGDIYLSAKNYNNALHYYMKAASAINGNKGYMMVDPNECLIFGSDVCSKIAEIYKMLGEIDLMCEYKNMALKSLKNELRPKKDEIEGKLNSFFLNCTNSK